MFILLAPLIQRGKGIKHCKNYSVGSVLAPSVGWTAVLHVPLLLHCCNPLFLFIASWYCLAERQVCYKTVRIKFFTGRVSYPRTKRRRSVCLTCVSISQVVFCKKNTCPTMLDVSLLLI